jgi:hypothetical protein
MEEPNTVGTTEPQHCRDYEYLRCAKKRRRIGKDNWLGATKLKGGSAMLDVQA